MTAIQMVKTTALKPDMKVRFNGRLVKITRVEKGLLTWFGDVIEDEMEPLMIGANLKITEPGVIGMEWKWRVES